MMRRNSHDSLLDGNGYPSNPPSYYTQMPPVYKQINHQPLYSNLPPPKHKQGAGYDMMYPSNQMKSHYHHDQMKYYSPYPDPNPGRNYEHENER